MALAVFLGLYAAAHDLDIEWIIIKGSLNTQTVAVLQRILGDDLPV